MNPTEKSPELTQLLQNLCGRTSSIVTNVCVKPPFGCGKSITPFRDALSEKEYRISGLCQECQDLFFGSNQL